MANKKQTYNFEFKREWKMKEPNWPSFIFLWFLQWIIQVVLLFIHEDLYFYGKIMIAATIVFWLIDGKYPYLKKTKIILTKCDVKKNNDE